jgi:hypothetical protein
MEKFAEVYKATLAVFHGIISTWLFLTFSERSADQFAFLILLAFFTVTNVLIWNLVERFLLRREPTGPTLGFNSEYHPIDVIALLIVSVFVGLAAAYVDRRDVMLKLANNVVDWERSATEAPFSLMISDIIGHRTQSFDKRDPDKVQAAQGGAYLRVYLKDVRLGYEGYPGRAPTKSEVREVVLTPACRFVLDANDPSKITLMERIEGPGVFLRLVDTAAIEIIDVQQSKCASLR